MSPKLEDYDVMGIIGSGSFGTCYKVRNRNTNEYFVWKAIDYGNLTESRKQLLVSEVNLLSELNHPNIVKYYNRILHKETTTLYIIMEWCQGGDLLSVIKHAKKLGTWLEEGFIWRALYQTGRALQACHTRLGRVTVLHRDIKPANIFLDHRGNIKLGDFGLARVLQGDNEYSQTIIGTPYYMSPEVVKGTKYNRKSDIWALGCLIYELCALVQPFSGSDIQELYNRIPDRYSENLVKMIQLMLTVQHEFRPTIEMVLHHPVVVTNVSKYEKAKLVESEEKQLSGIVQLMKSVHLEPEEVSENTFKEKWLYRLETLRRKEAKVKEREEAVEKRERIVARREKEVMLLERNARDKISRAEVYLHRLVLCSLIYNYPVLFYHHNRINEIQPKKKQTTTNQELKTFNKQRINYIQNDP
ncbi:hypothetical protein AAG570_012039 [Ranatra chinensis]|uniref:non-specific serine/threonine protein kinase n=1 Tax=Ranatra chinensis TaxID=642074 RepID=A0ABD0YZY5_9HEMI